MQKTYKVKFMGRKRNAIGMFYLCDLNFIADDEEKAKEMLFNPSYNSDFEVNNVVSVSLVTEKS